MEVNENGNTTAQNLWDAAKAVLRRLYSNPGYKSILRVYSNPGLPKEGRKISDTQPNLTPQGAGKRTANKTQNQQKIGNNKD